MSYDHTTVGFEKFDYFLAALKAAGVPAVEGIRQEGVITDINAEEGHIRPFRAVAFVNQSTKVLMIAEEALEVRDLDCDGKDVIGVMVYPAGQRPELEVKVLEA